MREARKQPGGIELGKEDWEGGEMERGRREVGKGGLGGESV